MERQAHGLFLEAYLADRLPSFTKSEGYTDEHDGTFETNDTTLAVSVKNTSKYGEICLGSFSRIISSYDSTLFIDGRHDPRVQMPDKILIHYLPSGFASVLLEGQVEDIQNLVDKFEQEMFSDDNLHIQEMRQEYEDDGLSFNDYEFDPYWTDGRKAFIREYKEMFDGEEYWIHPRPKRDHKSQKRLQCAIPKRFRSIFAQYYRVMEVVFDSNHMMTVFDWFKEYHDEDEITPERAFNDCYENDDCFEYIFEQYDDESYDDMERRAWNWVDYLLRTEI